MFCCAVVLHKVQNNFRDEENIEFRDANDLGKVLCTHSVAPHQPGWLCTKTPSVLLYSDTTKSPREIRLLDLDGPQPKLAPEIIHSQHDVIRDMCSIQDRGKWLLVIATNGEGLFAYNIKEDKIEWKVDEDLPGMTKKLDARGVTTDGNGHLFVTDCDGRSIEMFSASDGSYMGCLQKDAKALGDPTRLCWFSKAWALIAACHFAGKWYLKVININPK